MATLDSLETLFQEELKDIYDAEKQLTKALPKMAKKATSEDLKEAFEDHLRQTEQHIERLEQVFGELDMPVRGKKCEGMKHLIAEGDDMISDVEDDATRDALMVAAAQEVEHYEIASYGTMRTWASQLGKDDIASVLEETLEEEKETDQRLTSIAESFINQAAANEGEEEESEQSSGAWSRGGQSRARGTGAGKSARSAAAADRSRSGSRSGSGSRSRSRAR
jgi:ferritin-like metal-binding protein YciE